MNEYVEDDFLIILVDSIGIKVTNRGQWISDNWCAQNNNKKRRKRYLKIPIAVDVKSKKILSMQVIADEHVHDSKVLPELIDENILKSNKTIGKLFVDCACEGNNIFRYRGDNDIHPCIKVRKNAKVRLKTGHFLWRLSVLAQRNDFKRCKDSVIYGKRWMVAETAFSYIKRSFGEYTSETKFQKMVKEMVMKVSMYNLFRRTA